MSASEWIWRPRAHGSTVTCARCGASYSGADDDVSRLQDMHDPEVCATRAMTPQARRLRGNSR